MGLPLHTRVETIGSPSPGIRKILPLEEALDGQFSPASILVDLRDRHDDVSLEALASFGFAGLLVQDLDRDLSLPALRLQKDSAIVAAGDVIRLQASGQVNVLFRRGANANSLFVTERCNSKCLMCSQPPRDEQDHWRVEETLSLIALIDKKEMVLGITGGEPTLLDTDLGTLLQAIQRTLPQTRAHVLTNGRRFSEVDFSCKFDDVRSTVLWAVPLYADTAAKHDHIVQARGAFSETINGLYNLGERKHSIELRVVITALNASRLLPLAEFIYRNLSFVEHVTFMGLEPIGYARLNRLELWIDPADYALKLEHAVQHLSVRGLAVSIYNIPLCCLPVTMWSFARQSISDWKNVYIAECESCAVKAKCSGFFRSADAAWRSRDVHPISAQGVNS